MTSFVYNPISHKFDITNLTVMPPGTVGALTGNSGGAVGPDGEGNINIVGLGPISTIGDSGSNTIAVGFNNSMTNGQLIIGSTGSPPLENTLTEANGINVLNGAGSITLSNLRDVTPYVVSTVVGQAGYTALQDAIQQALDDGADADNPAQVLMYPGTYIEDVIFQAYISVGCISPESGVVIEGHCFYLDTGNIGLSNITFQANGSDSALQIGCNGNIVLSSCSFIADVGLALEVIGEFSVVEGFNCTIIGADGAPLSITNGNTNFYSSIVNGDSPSCSVSGDSTIVNFYASNITANFTIDSSRVGFYNSLLSSGFIIATLTSNALVYMFSCYVVCSAEIDNFIDGSGSILYGSLDIIGDASGISDTLTRGGSLHYSGSIATSPTNSNSAFGLALGSSFRNPNNFDVILVVYLEVSAATSGNILCGVATNAPPAQQTVVASFSTASTVIVPITVYLPGNYFVLISTSGTITATISGTQITAV